MEGVVTPIAILLIVSSSKGNTIPFRWPPRPARRQRTEQPEWKTSKGHIGGQGFGGGWSTGRRTSNADYSDDQEESSEDDNEAFFPIQSRINTSRKQSMSTVLNSPIDDGRRSRRVPLDSSQPSSRASSIHPGHSRAPSQARNRTLSNDAPSRRGVSPSISVRPLPHDGGLPSQSPIFPSPDQAQAPAPVNVDEYHTYLSFPTTFLAHILTPKEEICQQRFDLSVDDMCFIGHPMRRDGGDRAGGGWGASLAPDDERGLSSSTAGGTASMSASFSERGRARGGRFTPGGVLNLDSGINSPVVGRAQGASLPDVQEGKLLATGTSSTTGSSSAGGGGGPSGVHSKPPPSAPSTASSIPLDQVPSSSTTADKDIPSISFFHLVLVCDQPDGSLKGVLAPERKLEAVYKEIVFKVTAALMESQMRDNWVAKQGTELYNLRDTCLQELVPWDTFYEKALQMSPLARSLKKVFEAISAYPFSTNVTIGGLPFYVQLPLLPPSANLDWALWEDQNSIGDGVDSDYDEEEGEELYLTLDQSSTIRLAPWKALLLLDDGHAARSGVESQLSSSTGGGVGGRVSRSTSGGFGPDPRGRIDSSATAMFGGYWTQPLSSLHTNAPSAPTSTGNLSAPDSQTNTPRPGGTPLVKPVMLDEDVQSLPGVKEDEDLPLEEESTALYKSFVAAIKPNLSLAEIAQLPQFVEAGVDLKRDLYPLARRLVWKRRARIILPVKPGTRNIYLPSTSRGKNIPALIHDFEDRFPELGPFVVFFTRFASSPVPYGNLNSNLKLKKLYYEALLWLLRSDLAVLAPIRVRIRIRQEVKDKARANLTATRQALEDERDAEEDEEKKRNLDDLIDAMPREEEFSLLEEDASVIASPVECRGIERAWIDAMSDDKSPEDAELFQKVRRYFDGITTTHEIQYREELTRREMSHVLRVYEQDLITIIHP